MPIRRLTTAEVPQRRYSSFLTTIPEWTSTLEAIHEGLKPFEALEIKLSPELQRRSKWIYRSLAANFRKHIQTNHIPVEVRFYNDKDIRNQAVYILAPAAAGTNHPVPPVRRRRVGRPPGSDRAMAA